jgi:hypothetical protein
MVPKKMQRVTASTAQWPKNAPEQPATAMGAKATRYQGVSFMRGDLRTGASKLRGRFTCRRSYDTQRERAKLLQMSRRSAQGETHRPSSRTSLFAGRVHDAFQVGACGTKSRGVNREYRTPHGSRTPGLGPGPGIESLRGRGMWCTTGHAIRVRDAAWGASRNFPETCGSPGADLSSICGRLQVSTTPAQGRGRDVEDDSACGGGDAAVALDMLLQLHDRRSWA